MGGIHLVTGANGRTGFALCAELKSRGYFVRVLLREGAKKYLPFLEPYIDEVFYGDIRDAASLDAAFSGADYVYHLAAIVSIASKVTPEINDTNVTGVKNVTEACLKHKVRRLVHTGTIHTIPFYDTTSVLREIPYCVPEAVSGAYAVTKAKGQNIVFDAVRERGLNAVIGMPSGIIGGFELKRSNLGQMVADVAEGRLPVYTGGRYDYVDVRDVVRALADLAFAGEAGDSYILSGHIAGTKELIGYAAKAAGVRPPSVYIPLALAKLLAVPAEQYALRRGRTLTFTPYAMKVLGDNCNFSHEKISALTGYSPRPVEDAIKDQVDFYFNAGRRNGL